MVRYALVARAVGEHGPIPAAVRNVRFHVVTMIAASRPVAPRASVV
jgi:hypothetical protein